MFAAKNKMLGHAVRSFIHRPTDIA